MVPLPYTQTLLQETEIEAIHLDAEQAILTLQGERYKKEMDAIGKSYQGITRRLKTVVPPDTPRTKQQWQALKQESMRTGEMQALARTSLDSANAAYKKQEEVAYQRSVTLEHFAEKVKIENVKLMKIKYLIILSFLFLFLGGAMVLVGFTWWWHKEGAPRFRIDWGKKPVEPVPAESAATTTTTADNRTHDPGRVNHCL